MGDGEKTLKEKKMKEEEPGTGKTKRVKHNAITNTINILGEKRLCVELGDVGLRCDTHLCLRYLKE